MKNFILLLSLIFMASSMAQLRPAQSQYLKELGALVNPGFEQSDFGWDVTLSSCTKAIVADIPYLNRSLEITCTAGTFSVKQETTNLAPFVYQQALLNVQVKTDTSGVELAVLKNSTRDVSRSVPVGEYKNPQIPFVVDSTSNGVEVYADSAITGTVYIDLASLSLAPDYVQSVSEAQFVGSIKYDDDGGGLCSASLTSGTYANFPVDADCEYTNALGNISAPATLIPGFTISNVRTDGVYQVFMSGGYFNTTSSGNTLCTYDIVDSPGDAIGISTNQLNGNLEYAPTETSMKTLRFSDSSDKEITVVARREQGGGVCAYQVGSAAAPITFNVYFFPDQSSNIAYQTTELQEWENILASDVTSNGDIAGLQFSGLTIGKRYRLSGSIASQDSAGGVSNVIVAYSGASATGTIYGRIHFNNATNTQGVTSGVSLTFEATSTNVYFNLTSVGTIFGNGSKDQSFLQLVEEPLSKVIAGSFNQTNIDKNEDKFVTTETEWGLYDGKQLYRRCFSGSTADEDILVSGVDELVESHGQFEVSANRFFYINYHNGSGTFAGIEVDPSNNLVFESSATFNIKVCAEYTKI